MQSEVDVENRPSRVVAIDDAGADPVFSVLSSQAAREVLTELYREPAPLSKLADRTEMSLQNTSYHVDRLAEYGLVEVVDTWYSTRGREMDIYAPTNDPLLLVAGEGQGDTGTYDPATGGGQANPSPTSAGPQAQ